MTDETKKVIVSSLVSKFSIEKFVEEVQAFSLGLRHKHWETKSFARHKACEEIQETVDGLIDDFVEAYVGSTGGTRPTFNPSVKANEDCEYIIKCLKDINVKDSTLLNIRDELLQAAYKYKYLEGLN
jgi:predicted sugar kinase